MGTGRGTNGASPADTSAGGGGLDGGVTETGGREPAGGVLGEIGGSPGSEGELAEGVPASLQDGEADDDGEADAVVCGERAYGCRVGG